MRRYVLQLAACLMVIFHPFGPAAGPLLTRPAAAQTRTPGQVIPAPAISPEVLERLGLRASEDQPATSLAPAGGPYTAGQPEILNPSSALSAAVITTSGGPGDVILLADWDGREDGVADRSAALFALPGVGSQRTRAAISAHTRGNGQLTANVYYFGDTAGNFFFTLDTGSTPAIDGGALIHLPTLVDSGNSGGVTLLNPIAGDAMSNQAVVTGIAVNPVADLGDFNPGLCGVVGEIVYVSILDTAGGSANASNQPFRTRIFAFGLNDNVGNPTLVGAIQVLRNQFANVAGVAVDDDGSLYFQLVDLIQLSGAAIFKATELPRTVCGSASRINRAIPSIPSGLSGGISLTSVTPLTGGGIRLTNYSGTSTTFGNVVAITNGPFNTIYAAVARSFVSTDDAETRATEGLFVSPAALGSTPSMVISFGDAAGLDSPTGVPAPDGLADVAASGQTRVAGVNNFRAFVLGAGPDRRSSPGTPSPVFGTTADTLKVDLQIDATIHAGIAVDEARQVYVLSGGTPPGVGSNPSPHRGEILLFRDRRPADRRADYVDVRGNGAPNPPASGGNIGDGDSDRFDHIFWQAPRDPVTLLPTGAAGLARGFLRYTNRLAGNPLSPGMTNDADLGQIGGNGVQPDDTSAGPIFFDRLDPGHQVAGGDDQNTPFRGDDNDGGGSPAIAGPLNGGFEFTFGGIVGGCAPRRGMPSS